MSGQRVDRRRFGLGLAALATLPLAGRAPAVLAGARPHVVVVGAGFGGATLAKYIRLWDPGIDVTIVERDRSFVSCPMSNLVLSGDRELGQNTFGYAGLAARGVARVRAEVTAIDADRREVVLDAGQRIAYDRLALSPGIDFLWDRIEGLDERLADQAIPHAWKAGNQTSLLRRQLEALPDGGRYLISIPASPYRCPPGPYERASLIASYFKRHKRRCRIVVVDANPEITSKKGLFLEAWSSLYPGMIDYHPNSAVIEVDAAARTVHTDFDTFEAEILNVVPPQTAGAVAHRAGVVNVNGRWAGVDPRTFESQVVPGVHVLGDATSANPMPKSAHSANNQAKIAASAIIASLRGRSPAVAPVSANTCYSFVSPSEAVHVAAVYRYDPAKAALVTVEGTAGVSPARNGAEAALAASWAENIWRDTLF